MLKKFCEKHNIFYGWVVVACGILVMAVAYGIVCNCFSLYVKPVTEELGFTRQSFNVCVTITNVVFMLLSLFAAPHNGATMGVKGSPEMGKNKIWQSTFFRHTCCA